MHLVSSNSGGLPVELLWPYASSGLCLSFSLRLWCQRHLVTRHVSRTPEAAGSHSVMESERDYMTRPFGNAKQAKRNPIPKWWREKNVGKKTKTPFLQPCQSVPKTTVRCGTLGQVCFWYWYICGRGGLQCDHCSYQLQTISKEDLLILRMMQ